MFTFLVPFYFSSIPIISLENTGAYGGALSTDTTSFLSVTSCQFIANKAAAGGALTSLQNVGPISISNSVFAYNYCPGDGSSSVFAGGAMVLHIVSGKVDISNSTFLENLAVSGN